MKTLALARKQWWLILLVIFLATFPAYSSNFYVRLVTEMAIFALFATATNLMLGYGGTMPFGQAAFFGVGAYTCGLMLKKAGISLPIGLISAGVLAGLLAIMIGFLSLRLTGIYFAMITLAFSMLIFGIIWRWYSFTGGDDGLIGIPLPEFLIPTINYYYVTLGLVSLCIVLLRVIIKSPFGAILQSIRENRLRTEFIGINVNRHLIITFAISGFFCGISGALFALLSRGAFAEFAFYPMSIDVVLMCILGGVFIFSGPAIGAVIVILMESLLSSFTEWWTLIMGGILVLLVLFLPGGIGGFIQERRKSWTGIS